MDPEVAAYVNGLTAVVWTLSAFVVLLALGWLWDDPDFRAKVKKWWAAGSSKDWCVQHGRPSHECRDEHRA